MYLQRARGGEREGMRRKAKATPERGKKEKKKRKKKKKRMGKELESNFNNFFCCMEEKDLGVLIISVQLNMSQQCA